MSKRRRAEKPDRPQSAERTPAAPDSAACAAPRSWSAYGWTALAAVQLFLPILWVLPILQIPRDARPVLIAVTLLGPWLLPAVASVWRPGLRPALPWGLAAALLWWLAFPPAAVWALAFVAVVPWAVMTARTPSRLDWWFVSIAFVQSLIGGTCHWLTYSTEWGWAGMLVLSSGFYAAGMPLLRWLTRSRRLPWTVALPVVWTTVEWVRSLSDVSFPWVYLAHTQAANLWLLQLADLTGTWGVSFLLLLVNGVLADAWSAADARFADAAWRLRLPVIPAAVTAVLLLAAHGYGAFRLWQTEAEDGPRVMVLQTNIPQSIKEEVYKDLKDPAECFTDDVERTLEAAGRDKPDLIVWPETSCPAPLNPEFAALDVRRLRDDPEFAGLKRYIVRKQAFADAARARFAEISEAGGGSRLIIGYVAYTPDRRGFLPSNCAAYLSPAAGAEAHYAKIRLVPWGEYIPGKETFPFLFGFFVQFMPGGEPIFTEPGRPADFRPFEIPGPDGRTLRFATPICYEDTIAAATRDLVRDPATGGRRADFLVNISNDGWFEGSAELDMHQAIACFRAVEHRVAVVRSVNTGISAFITPWGTVEDRVTADGRDRQVAGTLTRTVRLDRRETVYTRLGDWAAWLCAAGSVGLAGWGLLRRTN